MGEQSAYINYKEDARCHFKEIAIKAINKIVSDLYDSQFYGSFKINFQNGKIVNCEKVESIKL